MPDVNSPALTNATAAQTRAAGSRMLGYYMDGPVKVDCVFDTANFLTKDADGKYTTDGANPNYIFNVATANPGRGIIADFANNAGTSLNGALISFTQNTIDNACFGMAPGAPDFAWYTSRNGAADGNERMRLKQSGDLLPGADNSQPIGSASLRWSVVYAGTGAINTSDERDKSWRGAPTEAELRAARRIAAELGFYQWNDAIAAKGADGARMHFGVRAQAVWAIMADEGLIEPLAEGVDPGSAYAFLCWDKWDAVEPVTATDEVRDGEGNLIAPARAAQAGRHAGSRFGVRVDQLALFLIAAQDARIAALEAAA